jgi:hypothetical protein
MADLYFNVWVTVTSFTIIVLVTAYIVYNRIILSYQSLDESEKTVRTERLESKMMTILGGLAVVGSAYWIYYIQTHEIYITKELKGFHDLLPGIIMGTIGLIVFILGIKKRSAGSNN